MAKDIFEAAQERAEKFGIRNVVVATNTGTSARRALEVFGKGCQVYAVGNPASAHERGLVHHKGVSEETKGRLEADGFEVILADQSLEQAIYHGRGTVTIGGREFDLAGKHFEWAALREVIEGAAPETPFNPLAIVFGVLNWFSDVTRVCVEIMFMAADSGQLPLDADCVSIARPSDRSNCCHAAVVLTPVRSDDMFKGRLRIKDVVLVPGPRDHWFNDQPLWQG